MTKEERHQLYRSSVCPGWWPILDRYVPKILSLDPNVQLYIKEKHGVLRIEMSSSLIDIDKHIEIENAAEPASSTVCEYCGRPGKLRTNRSWLSTLCDRCNHLNRKTAASVIQKAEQAWLLAQDESIEDA